LKPAWLGVMICAEMDLRKRIVGFWNGQQTRGKVLTVVVAVVGVLFVIGAISDAVGGGSDTQSASSTTSESTTAPRTTTTEAQSKPASPKERVREAVGGEVHAGGYAGDVQIEDVSFEGAEAQVTAKTPEGGFQGASCGDLNDGAQAIFQKIYNEGGWTGGAVIVYHGGLVSSATGQELPSVNTGIFTMPAARAQQINWSSDDTLLNIDWSIYRDFCHPALQ
jgi:hypothetical protein